MATDKRLGQLFEKLAQPDNKGFSKKIDIISLKREYEHLNVTNGSSYTREGSYLDEKYFMKKHYEKHTLDTRIEPHSNGIGKGKLLYIELTGYKK
jgi:hypothetical protein